jgi:nodulation protein E
MGTSIGGQQTQDAGFEEIYAQKKPKIHPYTIPRIMPSSGASHITMELGFTGPAYTISTACSSASHAIGQAYWMVRHGQVEAALAGGSECPFSLGFLKAWDALRVVSPDTCRPFSRGRQGLILGEGAGCLAIETVESAQARGASIYAEITGFGMSSDAGHITQPSVEGAASAISAALQDGGIDPERIGYVNAHGTGTQLNDVVETRALRAALGPAADKCPVSSTKSLHGHALGAAGALEAVASVLALHCGELPATANYLAPDPECDLDVITGESRKAAVEMALSNSFAFGGLNAVLAFQKAG